ncbi:Sec-independent protein translocase protein TatAd [Paenibacillus plantiphilus]|uniref:Sec-independent protein translocase protein TatA n=1 Tax=Paenibacillus plantiphilus TaxID=2905650 RepID=A0ABM9CA31_9BACL|nr:twin-arginine translocase TatA/TatE family subunit [Paenibacillus plantiphilus]CAH1205869.1 Sec-independent protein translocase protein TatAd [Paenibacillus plantiphilus]
MLGGLGVTGVILLVLVALLLFGPNKLPELGRAFGRTLKEFKAGARDIMEDSDKDQKDTSRIEVNRKSDEVADSKRLPD